MRCMLHICTSPLQFLPSMVCIAAPAGSRQPQGFAHATGCQVYPQPTPAAPAGVSQIHQQCGAPDAAQQSTFHN